MDPKAQRSQGVFEIKALSLEPGVLIRLGLVTDLATILRRLAVWYGHPTS